MLDRTAPCVDFLTAHRALVYNASGLVFSGGSYFPRNEDHQKAIDGEICPHLKRLTEFLYDDYVVPARNLRITNQEYSLARLLVFLTPVEGMTENGKQTIRQANHFYQNILTKLICRNLSNFDHAMERISQIMSFVQLMEVAKSISNSGFSVMTLFDIANLNGELTYDVHVRQGFK